MRWTFTINLIRNLFQSMPTDVALKRGLLDGAI
jgi:hypothetical protein